MKIHGDFESQSEYDLREGNSDGYAKHPSTRPVCLALAFDEGPVHLWKPGDALPTKVFKALQNGAEFWGHNVGGFEWYLWNYVCVPRYGFPILKIEQCFDTMAMANAMGLPGSLKEAALASGINLEKDDAGYRVMMFLCKPMANGKLPTPQEFPEKFAQLYAYCKKDVEVERALCNRLRPLSPTERKIWIMDQRINQRGVGIDIEKVRQIDQAVTIEQERMLKRLHFLTNGKVPSVNSHAKFKAWLHTQGVNMVSIAKDKIAKELEKEPLLCPTCMGEGVVENLVDPENGSHETYVDDCPECIGVGTVGSLNPVAREAILIRQEAAKSSNAKYRAMAATCVDGRSRNMFEYYGARQTGRWAGRKIQLQNMPKNKMSPSDLEYAISRFGTEKGIKELTMLYGSVVKVASECIRPMLKAEKGQRFISADWSNIEGRVAAWLASEEWKIRAFANFDLDPKLNPDIYKLSYSRAFGVSIDAITDDMRQIGKTMELAFGFQGGVGAFHTMGKNLGVKVSDKRAKELVDAWRTAHPKIKAYWYALEEAAVKAIKNPGASFGCGEGKRKILYQKSGSFLCCRLPSGRVMYYPYPKFEEIEAPWGGEKMSITYMRRDSVTKVWFRVPTFGGKLFENIVQGFSREILAHGMLRVEDAGYPIVIHVHDEPVSEVPIGSHHSVKEFERLLMINPDFAPGLPIAAKGWEGPRYIKI